VQVPPDGNPIVLGVDGPTTGGYAKPFVVIRADLGILARLAPSARVRLREVTRDEAADAWRDLQARRKEILGGA
jgi:allophanate hydrolase subunit 2